MILAFFRQLKVSNKYDEELAHNNKRVTKTTVSSKNIVH